jgi:ATP-dependent Clp protease ATP-binding subunit ClpC
VRQRPYSVVLFDEIEKAHPDVMDLLLQILEEGRLTDSYGNKVDFRNTVVIMTSNIGADLIRKSTEIGFGAKEGSLDYDTIKEKIEADVMKKMKPEFLNRLDNMVIFKPLSKEDLMEVIKLEVDKLQERISVRQIFIELDDKAKEFLINKGFQPEMGARPLRRKIEEYLADPLTDKLLTHPNEGRRYKVTLAPNGNELQFDVIETLPIVQPPKTPKASTAPAA